LTKAQRFDVHLVSQLDDATVRRMRMTPARTIADALAQAGVAADAQGFVMPYGARYMPVVVA
jgi:hypothetical protein